MHTSICAVNSYNEKRSCINVRVTCIIVLTGVATWPTSSCSASFWQPCLLKPKRVLEPEGAVQVPTMPCNRSNINYHHLKRSSYSRWYRREFSSTWPINPADWFKVHSVKRCSKYNITICVSLVNYENAFDSVQTQPILTPLQEQGLDGVYTEILKEIFTDSSVTVHIKKMVRNKDQERSKTWHMGTPSHLSCSPQHYRKII